MTSRSLLNSNWKASASLSPFQAQLDGLVTNFVEEASDWRSVAAMTAGGLAYHFGRLGAYGLGSGRIASVGFGLVSEVSAFELTQRSLHTLAPSPHSAPPSQLWRWGGNGGIVQGWLSSLISFGALKGAGRFSAGSNPVFQHLFQDSAMVLGHQASGALGIVPRPSGSLSEQFLHAEAANLQMGAGVMLGHHLSGGRIHALERSLNISLRTPRFSGERFLGPQFAWAVPTENERGSFPSPHEMNLSLSEGKPSESKVEEPPPEVALPCESLSEISDWLYETLRKGTLPQNPYLEDLLQGLAEHRFDRSDENLKDFLRSTVEEAAQKVESLKNTVEDSELSELRTAVEFLRFYQERAQESFPSHPLLSEKFEEFSYHLKSHVRESAPALEFSSIPYPPEIDAALQRIEAQIRAPDYLEGSREELLAKRANEDDVDRVWIHQVGDLHRRLPGSSYEIVDVSKLEEWRESCFWRVPPEILEKALALLGPRNYRGSPARQVGITHVPPNHQLDDLIAESFSFTQLFGDALGFMDESSRLAEVPPHINKYPTLSLSLQEKILQVIYGLDWIHYFYVDGTIPQDPLVDLRSKRLAAVGLSRNGIVLEDINQVLHPAGFAGHDTVHAQWQAALTGLNLEIAVFLYRRIQATLPPSSLKAKVMDLISDAQLPSKNPRSLPISLMISPLPLFQLKNPEQNPEAVQETLVYLRHWRQLIEAHYAEHPFLRTRERTGLIAIRQLLDKIEANREKPTTF